jgi:23S rRNA pseudouridine1911/1915/1917 synthase
MSTTGLRVLFEDNHIIAVNKMPADIVQGDKTGDPTLADTVKDYLREKYAKKGNVFIGTVHRLDRPVSGIVLYARTDKALQRLSQIFREGGVRKLYWALVAEAPPKDEDTLVHWISRNPELNKSFASKTGREGAKEARLRYRVLFSLERYRLLEIELLTGRHHQIRAQLHAIGCHIKGDLKYGSPRSNPGGGIHLHAREVSFLHPVRKQPVTITADPPADPLWDAALAKWRELRDGS